MHYFAYIVDGWVKKKGKLCLRNKSMAPYISLFAFKDVDLEI